MFISYPVILELRHRPHRPTESDGLDRISVKEPKCFLISEEKINTLMWENKTESQNPQTVKLIYTKHCRVCMKHFWLSHKHTHSPSSCATDSVTSDLQPLGPHYPCWICPAQTIIDSNVTSTVVPHWRHPNCYSACARVHVQTKHTKCDNPTARLLAGFYLTAVAMTPVHVNQKGHIVGIRDSRGQSRAH